MATPSHRNDSSLPGLRLSLAATLVCLGGSANFAYQLIITNPAQKAFLSFLNESIYRKHGTILPESELNTFWSLIVSSLYWGTIIGSLLIQWTSEKFGRKHGLTVANGGQAFALVLSLFAYYREDYILYTASRIILGIFQAISLGIGPMYIMECSPARCRGVISLSTALFMQSFIVVAAVVAMPNIWGTESEWWKLYAYEIVPLILVIFLSFLLPESPAYLSSKQKYKEAAESTQFYHGLVKEEAERLTNDDHSEEHTEPLGLLEIWRNPEARRGTILGCLVMFSMTFCGIVAVNAFAVEILMNTGLDVESASYANVGICLISVFGVLLSSLVVDKYGRRSLILFGIVFLSTLNVAVFGLMFGFDRTKNVFLGFTLIAIFCLFIFMMCATIGPICFFITSELVDGPARSAAQTWANLVLSLGRSILLAVFLPLQLLLGPATTYVLLSLPPLVFSGVYIYYNLPESRGKTYPQVVEEYKKLPGKKVVVAE